MERNIERNENRNGAVKQRALALDALRGYAILTMVLSATVVYGILPDWMYHAQVPPPDHVFNPNLPGLTWVDLVFPSFLFALGAALPFSVGRKHSQGAATWRLALSAVWRGIKLAFFAIVIQHLYPYMTGSPQCWTNWVIAILGFALLFAVFMRLPAAVPAWMHKAVPAAGVAAIAMLLYAVHGSNFSLSQSNIIILILANVSVSATLLYVFTIHRPMTRIAVTVAVMALFIAAGADTQSWAAQLLNYTPAPWLYQPRYLEYLLIVIPGTFAGEMLREHAAVNATDGNCDALKSMGIAAAALALVIVNLCCLQCRALVLNLVLSAVLLVVSFCMVRRGEGYTALWRKLWCCAAALLVIGLCFEPFEGGIKKDPVTVSYLLVTAGLGFATLVLLSVVVDRFGWRRSTAFLVESGQNPMVAYVAVDLVVYPVLNLLGVTNWFGIFGTSPWLGALQGFILTALAVAITMFCTRRRCVWRT